MNRIYIQLLLASLLVLDAHSLAAQSQNKVVVIPLDSQRPAIKVVDNKGATVGAATAGNFVAMSGNLNASRRTPVFLVPLLQGGFFSLDTSFGVTYSGSNCTGTPKILTTSSAEFPALEIANVGFDPDAGPHELGVGISEIRAFIRVSPTTTVSAAFSSAAVFEDGQWQCVTVNGVGVGAVEVEPAVDLSPFSPPFSAQMR